MQSVCLCTIKCCMSAESSVPEALFCLCTCIKVKSCHARFLLEKHDYKKVLGSMEDNMFSAQR